LVLNLSGVGQLGHLHLDVHHVPLSLATNYIGINLCKSCTCFDKLGGSCQKSCCSRPVGTRVLSVMSRMSRLRMQRWASNSFPLVVNTYSQKNWFCIGVIHLGTQILYIYIYIHIYIDGSLMSLTSGCRDIQSVIWGQKNGWENC
jgi:hypothetical protein